MRASKNAIRPTIEEGSVVFVGNDEFIVAQVTDIDEVIGENVRDGNLQTLPLSELSLKAEATQEDRPKSKDSLSEQDWNIANERYEIIHPLINRPSRKTEDVDRLAEKHGLHRNTIYSWLRCYEQEGLVSVLAPKQRSDKGTTKIDNRVEHLITETIEEEYLTKQRKSVSSLIRTIEARCRRAKLPCPHANTIRNRVKNLSDAIKVRRRFGSRAEQELYRLSGGEFPGADYPNSYIQIDHTRLDIILVDDEHRLPIDRPWVTMAIDVFSRMVVGFYISFDTPSATSTGICLSNSILSKDAFLSEHDIDATWPCRGFPRAVHADNAKEFRGNVLKKACVEYGIDLIWRPVARPHFGGHIERLLGTFAKEIHNLPGTTFSNIQQRANYDSTKNAALTLLEFERWLAILITEVYHQRVHSAIQCSPIEKYRQGILGTTKTKGIGLPSPVSDPQRLKLDFLPFEHRTVQDYGIRLNNIFYNSEVLGCWVNATESTRTKKKREFLVRYDPRDMSRIWFFDPQLAQYFEVPYRNMTHRSITLWEIKKAHERLREEGYANIDEDMIFDAIERMEKITQAAIETTKSARKTVTRKKVASKKANQHLAKAPKSELLQPTDIDDEDDVDEIEPFSEMEEISNHD
ncbi:MAG: Mu transposase C-terminal domain-containing protein [Idiomarina sp.]